MKLQLQDTSALRRLRSLAPSQSLSEAVANEREKAALDALIDHLVRHWREESGISPTEGEVKRILELVYIEVLDVLKGGQQEREARDLLRTAVLQNGQQDTSAWARLITECESLASGRSGVDRRGLQRLLLDAGFALRPFRSYRKDIDRLLGQTQTTLKQLKYLATVTVEGADVWIERASTVSLQRAAADTSLLVVGEPGAGKSGALYDLVSNLEADRAVVLLAVDQLAAASVAQLRIELGLEHELHDVLSNWPLQKPGVLVIDALDAERGSGSGAFRDLIRLVIQGDMGWRVVASIRKFDLRHSHELRELFRPGVPLGGAEFQDQEFAGLAHLSIPLLSDTELLGISSQSQALGALIAAAPIDLKSLLRVPFNLDPKITQAARAWVICW